MMGINAYPFLVSKCRLVCTNYNGCPSEVRSSESPSLIGGFLSPCFINFPIVHARRNMAANNNPIAKIKDNMLHLYNWSEFIWPEYDCRDKFESISNRGMKPVTSINHVEQVHILILAYAPYKYWNNFFSVFKAT